MSKCQREDREPAGQHTQDCTTSPPIRGCIVRRREWDFVDATILSGQFSRARPALRLSARRGWALPRFRGSRAGGGRPDCVHRHQAKASSHASYLPNQHVSMCGLSPNRIVVTCESGSRQQIETIVQLIPECHHVHQPRSLDVSTNLTVTSRRGLHVRQLTYVGTCFLKVRWLR